jgi:hypothetical protein
MPSIFTTLRSSWLALAVFACASLLVGDASAACASMPDAGGCESACCCEAPVSASPIQADAPATLSQNIPVQDANVCRNVPGCHCRPQAPTAPEPKQRRAGENRVDRSRHVDAARVDTGDASRTFIEPVSAAVSPPQKAPLYLRNSRLLI